jgi:hypothetical protein
MVMLFFLTSCAASFGSFETAMKQDVLKPMNLWEPTPWGIQLDPPPGGTPEFNQGWKDGCTSGIAAYGGDNYKYTGYKFKQDWRMVTNNTYYQAWQDAYLYCRWYMWNFIQKPPGVAGQWVF